MKELDQFESEIAVIGMSGRFPGAPTLEEYWCNLCAGKDSISRSSATNGDSKGVHALGKLDNIDLFDAGFFNFTPREAEITDPQHRLLLECAWEALEDAGYGSEVNRGTVGVYAGAAASRYGYMLYSNKALVDDLGEIHALLGNERDFLATRISYKLNLCGPSMLVQTACSTALVATHLACQSLLNGECDLALAGGVSLMRPSSDASSDDGGVLSPDGCCRAFDANARGTVSGEAVGVIMLKRLNDAYRDGDPVHAIIKGSAINNDGARKFGFTAPSVEGQSRVIAEAMTVSGVAPETITYIEAHGTGTPLGDPVEIAALTHAYRQQTKKNGFCAIGSVKTNIGHTDAAAGIAGMVKTILAMKHGMVPPSLHFEEPNPEIDFANSPFYVSQVLSKWEVNGFPRRAGVSSFGIGGTNAHLILEEPASPEAAGEARPYSVFILSARTPSALTAATGNMARYLNDHPDLNLADAAFTLQVGRKEFSHRRAVVCSTRRQIMAALTGSETERVFSGVHEGSPSQVTFLFPSAVAHCAEVGRELYQHQTIFRANVDHCAQLLKPLLGIDLRECLFPAVGNLPDSMVKIGRIAEAAAFVVEYALAQWWIECGVQPAAMVGEGVGEYVAACLAEVFSLEEALALLAGVVQASAAADTESPAVDSSVQQWRLQKLNPPGIPYVSGVTGDWIRDSEATGFAHWLKVLSSRPRIEEGLAVVLKGAEGILLEVGAGERISGLLKSHAGWRTSQVVLASLPAVRSESTEEQFALETLGRLWLAGVDVQWDKFHAGQRRQRVHLPTYPFERQRYWIDFERYSQAVAEDGVAPLIDPSSPSIALLEKHRVEEWFHIPSWKRSLPVNAGVVSSTPLLWLAFVERDGLGEQLAARLEQQGSEVIRILPGESFARLRDRVYVLNFREHSHYEMLLQQITKAPDALLHAWSLAESSEAESLASAFEEFQHLGFSSLAFLMQSFHRIYGNVPVRLEVVSQRVQEVTGEEQLSPGKATILGICSAISQEFPNVKCRSVDMGRIRPGTTDEPKACEHLWQEINTAPSELFVAYRGSYRLVPEFKRISLRESAATPLLRKGGTYLITNGLAEGELFVARYLARSVKARLVLFGPPDFPNERRWNLWKASHSSAEKVSRSIAQLQEMTELGAEILILPTPAGDVAQWKQVLETARERFGPIHGVVYGSAALDRKMFCSIREMDDIFCLRQVQMKAQMLLALHAAFEDQPPDFFMLLHAMPLKRDTAGQSATIAIDRFLCAHALKQNASSNTRWISAGFTGLPVIPLVPGQVNRGIPEDLGAQGHFMTPAEAQQIFSCIATGLPGPQIVVAAESLEHCYRLHQSSPVVEVQVRKNRLDHAVPAAAEPLHPVSYLQPSVVASPVPVVFQSAPPIDVNGEHAPASPVQAKLDLRGAAVAAKAEKDHRIELVSRPPPQPPASAVTGKLGSSPLRPRPKMTVAYVAPATEGERTIARIWQELLGVQQIGVNDAFFQLGGDSLLATQSMSKLRTAFNLELPLRYFFEYPTVHQMYDAIQSAREKGILIRQPAISRISREAKGETAAVAVLDSGPAGKNGIE